MLWQIVCIAMGGVGSDIAVDAADIALVDDKIEELQHLLDLSKKMMTTIKLNLTFSMMLSFTAVILILRECSSKYNICINIIKCDKV